MDRLFLLVFVVYCTSVGVILTMLPWSPAWERMLSLLPYHGLGLLENTWLRGAFSGFGLIHLVWGAHDLHALLEATLMPTDGHGR